jgi:hypothetical protein
MGCTDVLGHAAPPKKDIQFQIGNNSAVSIVSFLSDAKVYTDSAVEAAHTMISAEIETSQSSSVVEAVSQSNSTITAQVAQIEVWMRAAGFGLGLD